VLHGAPRFHTQAAGEGLGWLARRHVARLPQVPLPPAPRQANFDLVPVACDRRAVEMPIATAHHHPVGFDHEHPWCWVVLADRRFVRLFNARHRHACLAFQFRANAFGLRPQRLAAEPRLQPGRPAVELLLETW